MIVQFIMAHQFWAAVALYWIFSAAVSAMPDPDSSDGKGYQWLYKMLHTLAGNISTVVGSKIPGGSLGPRVGMVLLMATLVLPAGCGKYILHPGSVDRTDSAAYDVLLISQAAIDKAKELNPHTPTYDQVLGDAVKAYNAARLAWLDYRDVVGTKDSPDRLVALTKAMNDLNQEILALKGAK